MNNTLSRRSVFAVAAATLAASAALAEDAPAKTRRPMKKSFFGGAKKGEYGAYFKMLKEAGFDGVQLNVPGPDVAEVVEASKSSGILVEGICASKHWQLHLSDPEASIRKAGLDSLMQAMREGKQMGASTVLLVPGVVNEKVAYDDCYKRSQEEIRKAIPLAGELGIKIAIENVWNSFHLSPVEAARYVDELESPSVGWYFDVGNVMHFGFPEQWIRILGKRILKIHIKEYDRKKSDKEGKWAGFKTDLLEGSNNWQAIMRAFDDVGYNTDKHWATIEMGGGNAERMKLLSDRLDKILAS